TASDSIGRRCWRSGREGRRRSSSPAAEFSTGGRESFPRPGDFPQGVGNRFYKQNDSRPPVERRSVPGRDRRIAPDSAGGGVRFRKRFPTPCGRQRSRRMRQVTAAIAVGLAAGVVGIAQAPRAHDLKLLPENVHWGYYDPAVRPVLRIASGDTVRVEAMIARGLQRLRAAGVAEDEIPDALKVVERTVTERGPGAHPLTGPIYVGGAEPGDALEVKIVAFEFLHPYGVSGFIPGSGTLPEDFPYVNFHLVRFDPRAGTAAFAPGVTLRLAPFFGSIGVA